MTNKINIFPPVYLSAVLLYLAAEMEGCHVQGVYEVIFVSVYVHKLDIFFSFTNRCNLGWMAHSQRAYIMISTFDYSPPLQHWAHGNLWANL
ncbi:hypothetical protein I3760_03G207200 [Carya illinoinensis]|nr:hypothetical protein I3760_03G207200 [Carya illinoinensis]